MSYLVIARKWRPVAFEDVVGQEHVSTTLKNAINGGRISHAYIFAGPRGVGKTSTARILARSVNCQNRDASANPCNTCASCTEINLGKSMDVIEIDGASNRGIDEIRNLREGVRYPPVNGTYKVYIIDEFHMITKDAFNALLKTLEEPPPHVMFIFATTEPHKVLPTILSRCQRFDFKRIPTAGIVERLAFIAKEESVQIDEASLYAIAQKCDGAMRDALTLLDQIISFAGTEVKPDDVTHSLGLIDHELFFELTDIIRGSDTRRCFEFVERVLSNGVDMTDFLNNFLGHVRNLLVARAGSTERLIDKHESVRKRYHENREAFTEHHLMMLMSITTDTLQKSKWAAHPRLIFELGLLKMCKLPSSRSVSELLNQIRDLESGTGASGTRQTTTETKASTSASSSAHSSPRNLSAAGIDAVSVQAVSPKPPEQLGAAPTGQTDSPNTLASVGDVRQHWEDLVGRVKKEKHFLGIILEHCAPETFENGTLTLALNGKDMNEFHRDRVTSYRELINREFEKLSGRSIKRVKFTLAAAHQAADGQNAGTATDGAATPADPYQILRELEENEPLIRKMIDMFGLELRGAQLT